MVGKGSTVYRLSGIKSFFVETNALIRTEWIAATTLSLIAMIANRTFPKKGILIAIVMAVGYAFAFMVNDYYDKAYDLHDIQKSKRNLFARGKMNQKNFLMLSIGMVLFLTMALLPFGIPGLIFVAFSCFFAWAYSAKPFRFKSRPVIDLITHSLLISTYPYLGTLILLKIAMNRLNVMVLCATALFSFGNQLENQLRDFETDKKTDTNFTTTFGFDTSLKLLKTCSIVLLLLLLILLFTLPAIMVPIIPFLSITVIERALRPRDWNQQYSKKIKQATALFAIAYVFSITSIRFLT